MVTQYSSRRRGVIPPYLLERLASGASESVRDRARRTQQATERLRAQGVQGVAAQLRLRAAASATSTVVQRHIYDAQQGSSLPGTLVRDEGDPAGDDVAVNEAYDYLGVTHDFFLTIYARNSIDDQGLPLIATVHYERDYANAFWNGEQMVFGDGDGEVFNRFTISLDVIGHELTHGVTETSANLEYQDQSGALNESVSDVFGVLIKQYANDQTAEQADWIVGAGLFVEGINGVGLRSLKAPGTAYDDPALGKDPQPATMAGYVATDDDNGGVHINSGIPNHAFYLAATAIGGAAWEKAGRIWYRALTGGQLAANADFAAFAALTGQIAEADYGADSVEANAVRQAWRDVGVVTA